MATPAPLPEPRPVAGVLWMLLTGLCFVAVIALVKYLGDGIPAAQSAFLRYLLGLVFVLPMLRPLLRARPTRREHGLFAARGLLHALGVILWFYAMTRIPIAEVTAMNYLSPVYVTLGAAIFLGERLAVRRVAAVVVALMGALLILRPGFRDLDPGHLAMLGTAVIFGGSYLLAKALSDAASPAVVVAMLSFWVTAGLAPVALAVWVPPSMHDLAVLLGVAFFATAGHFTMTLAFRAAPITVTQPVTFLQLVWAVTLGAVVFGEPVDPFVILGGLVIVGSVVFISWREAVLKRRSITPPAPATKL
ncbi:MULTISPECIES: DMT family transporter [unclassified Rhodosalinus]|uniref:DMT family transporter n=1 Tax=unclassified Rhodosalinus TaxID=2630183 RepID=UPI0035257237